MAQFLHDIHLLLNSSLARPLFLDLFYRPWVSGVDLDGLPYNSKRSLLKSACSPFLRDGKYLSHDGDAFVLSVGAYIFPLV